VHFIEGGGLQRALRVGVVEAENLVAAVFEFVLEAKDGQRINREPFGRRLALVGGGDEPSGRLAGDADEKAAGFLGPQSCGRFTQLVAEESPGLAVGKTQRSVARGR
jgi:hypothetical protein